MSDTPGVAAEFFEQAYSNHSPPWWDIGRPQDDVVRLYGRGGFQGKVLDLGCGTGENALFLAKQGLQVTGLDRVPRAIEQARSKARTRGLSVTFEIADVLDLAKYQKSFDTLLDCGLFHWLSDHERTRYLKSLSIASKARGKLHLLCFSNEETSTNGPRQIAERELITTFNLKGWLVEEVAEARFESHHHPEGARAWLATFSHYPS